jgi:histidyl-tRNA synthetase
VFVLIEDEVLRAESLRLIQQWRDGGVAVEHAFTPTKPDKQFKRAMELKVASTAKLERDPSGALIVRIRRSATREERVCPASDAAGLLAALRA